MTPVAYQIVFFPIDYTEHLTAFFQGKKDDVEKHEKHAQAEHLELLTRKVAELELKSMDTQSALQVRLNCRCLRLCAYDVF